MAKCQICDRKANNLGLVCKCNGLFCMEHRLPESHSCTYDYRTELQKKLTKQLEECAIKEKRI